MNLETSPAVRVLCEACNPRQVFFFVCSSRKQTATAVEAHIGLDEAKRAARKVGGCVRAGWYNPAYKRATITDETPPWETKGGKS